MIRCVIRHADHTPVRRRKHLLPKPAKSCAARLSVILPLSRRRPSSSRGAGSEFNCPSGSFAGVKWTPREILHGQVEGGSGADRRAAGLQSEIGLSGGDKQRVGDDLMGIGNRK